jgi:hypothetical protein
MLRDPRREDQTTCTAAAPDFVFTVRTYGTGPLYGPARQASGSPGNQPPRTGVTRTGTPPPGETARQLEAPAEPLLVRKFPGPKPETLRSARCTSA